MCVLDSDRQAMKINQVTDRKRAADAEKERTQIDRNVRNRAAKSSTSIEYTIQCLNFIYPMSDGFFSFLSLCPFE